jgi:hypothetical protein
MKNKWQVIVSVRRLFVKRPNKELGAKAPSTSTGPVNEFFGTKGWFTGFRKKT